MNDKNYTEKQKKIDIKMTKLLKKMFGKDYEITSIQYGLSYQDRPQVVFKDGVMHFNLSVVASAMKKTKG